MSPGIPRIRSSVVCRSNDRLLTLRALEPGEQRELLILPGGAIEAGESPAAAAVRETLEETGCAIRVDEPPVVKRYQFVWNRKLYDCQTHFFRGHLIDPAAPPAAVHDEDYLLGVEWMPIDAIERTFGEWPAILDAVRQLI